VVLVALDDPDEACLVAKALEKSGIDARVVSPGAAFEPGSSRVGVVFLGERRLGAEPSERLAALERAHGPDVRVLSLASGRSPAIPAGCHALPVARPVDPVMLGALVRANLDAHARALEARTLSTELERANRTREDFFTTLSHELRTPLTPILGWAQILKRSPVDAKRLRAGLEVIERNARQQAALVSDLLDLCRAQQGRLELECELVDVRELAIQQALLHMETARRNGQNLEVGSLDGGEPLYVHADSARLNQVLGHLIGNAIKFTPCGGSIAVRVYEAAESGVVEVADSGAGIDPAQLEDTFRVFWQADSGTKRRKGGLGIGLALAKLIVDAHGGALRAASPGMGRGATFTLSLPRVANSTPTLSTSLATGDIPSRLSPRPRVLVVDDDEDTRTTLRELLIGEGFEVTLAASGPAALELAGLHPPSIIVTDLAMPEMDGFELARALKAHPYLTGTPLIALSGQGEPLDEALARNHGFRAALVKPTSPAALLATLRSELARADRR
jgi:signal transduction histidine kinase/ActR/RegA family two-component response regulator